MPWANRSKRDENAFPSEFKSWKKARKVMIFGIIWVIILSVLMPFMALVSAVVVVVYIIAMTRLRKPIATYRKARLEMLVDRKFKLDELPIHPDDAESDEQWTSKGIPWYAAYRSHVVNGEKRDRAYKVLIEEHRGQVLAIKQFVHECYPEYYKLVLEWWQQEVLRPGATDLGFTAKWRDIPKADQQELTSRFEVDLFEGMAEAMCPDRWFRKVDVRPTFQRLQRLRNRLRAEFPDPDVPQGVPWITFPRRKEIYFGKGYEWLPRHTERLELEASKDLDELVADVVGLKKSRQLAEDIDGEPRAFGVGADEIRDIYFPEKSFSQHAVVLGGSGFGKSRAIESAMMTAIANGDPVFILDPKGDPRLINLAVELSRRFGRANEFQFTSLVDPYNLEICTFNPLADYLEPTELQGRMLSVVPESPDQPFFAEEAASTGATIGTVCHYMAQYLALLGDGNTKSSEVPEMLLWIQYLKSKRLERSYDDLNKDEHRAILREIIKRMRSHGPRFNPENEVEDDLFKLWMCEEYRPVSWLPNFGHVAAYGVQRPWRLISWAMKIVYFHVMIEHESYQEPDWPMRDTQEIVYGKDEDFIGVVKLYQDHRIHPLHTDAEFTRERLCSLYEPIYSEMVTSSPRLQHSLNQFDEALNNHIAAAILPKEEFDKRNSSLKSPVTTLSAGGKKRLLCDPDADVTWRRVTGEKRITYLALGQMVDKSGSNAVSKAVIQGLTAHLGQVLAKRPDNPPPLWFFGDEMPSWATSEWSDIIDKARSAGIRTFNLSQTLAGMRAAIGNTDKVLHMVGSFATALQFGVQNLEDCKLFAEISGEVKVSTPDRSVGVNPGIGEAGNTYVSMYSASENRNFADRQVPLVSPTQVAKMPIGQCYVKRFGKFYIAQVGLLPEPKTDYLKEIGINTSEEEDGVQVAATIPGEELPMLWLPASQDKIKKSIKRSKPTFESTKVEKPEIDEFEQEEPPDESEEFEQTMPLQWFYDPALDASTNDLVATEEATSVVEQPQNQEDMWEGADDPTSSEGQWDDADDPTAPVTDASVVSDEASADDMWEGADDPTSLEEQWDDADDPTAPEDEEAEAAAIEAVDVMKSESDNFGALGPEEDLDECDESENVRLIDEQGFVEVGETIGGMRQGQFQRFSPDGKLVGTGPYVDDERHGEWVLYDENGEELMTQAFVHGNPD